MKPLLRSLTLSAAAMAASLCVAGISSSATGEEVPPSAFKLFIHDDGVYRVTYEQLSEAGLGERTPAAATLRLSNRGEPVPLWITDDDDQRFGPGEAVEFVGAGVRVEQAGFDPYLSENVYILDFAEAGAARMQAGSEDGNAGAQATGALTRRLHLEKDELLPRFSGNDSDAATEWYWAKLTHIDDEPFAATVEVADLANDEDSDGEATSGPSLRLRFRGWSYQPARDKKLVDHRVEISVNGHAVGTTEWDGTAEHTFELDRLPAEAFVGGSNRIELSIPPRTAEGADDPVVDVVMLDWIAVSYPCDGTVASEQSRVWTSATGDTAPEQLRVTLRTAAETLTVYTDNGRRIEVSTERDPSATTRFHSRAAVVIDQGTEWLDIVADRAFGSPKEIIADRPSSLVSESNRADYIVVTTAHLADAVAPLVEFHRSAGLAVTVADIEDVYDEFYFGLPHPEALRKFLAHAYHQWAPPRPRFVLLVGDASWDTKHFGVKNENYDDLHFRPGTTEFAKIPATPYRDFSRLNHRNLIPTGSYHGGQGHSASDNWLVSIDGDDSLPDMAVGRFPVVTPAEVAGIVRKTLAYAQSENAGPWRRRALWITNEEKWPQRQTDELAAGLAARGIDGKKIYPSPSEEHNKLHQAALRAAFDEGQLLVHFHGHGGRYIWRTGPPDLRKNHDLFTLTDLDKLRPTTKLPVVLSMSCYSAPFDHPNADSIGEKFLRLPNKGAVAVIAASWRNAPTKAFSETLLTELLKPDATVGEALQRAKQSGKQPRTLVEQYNLLGDPALRLALPALDIELTVKAGASDDGAPMTIDGRVVADSFRGRALVEWLDATGAPLTTEELGLDGATFSLSSAASEDDGPTSVRVYAWGNDDGPDALGALVLREAPPRPDPRATRLKAMRERNALPGGGKPAAPAENSPAH